MLPSPPHPSRPMYPPPSLQAQTPPPAVHNFAAASRDPTQSYSRSTPRSPAPKPYPPTASSPTKECQQNTAAIPPPRSASRPLASTPAPHPRAKPLVFDPPAESSAAAAAHSKP